MQFSDVVSPTHTLASAKLFVKANEMHSDDRRAVRLDCRKARYAVRSVLPSVILFTANVAFSRGTGWRGLCSAQTVTDRTVGYNALLAGPSFLALSMSADISLW